MIKAIFYSKFDTQEGELSPSSPPSDFILTRPGPKVVHQVPDGALVPSSTAPSQALFLTFSDISFFVIPRQELCGNLIQVCANGHRILGYPICIKSHRYDRNEFIFNFCVVLAAEEDFSTYKSVVQKLADLMRELEEQSGFLSRDHSKSGEGKVYSLCETLMEDLNNYCESMIPIDDLNTLNIKLFPVYPAPPPVKAWQVPLFTVRYHAFMDENWDLTMQRIVPYINGVNSVRIISILADADFSLTCRAIRHLLYYGCLLLLDIFSFSAVYAPTAQFNSTIASDESMQRECARYVNTLFAPQLANPSTTAPGQVSIAPWPSSRGDFIARTGSSGTVAAATGVGNSPPFGPDEVWPPVGDDALDTDTDTADDNDDDDDDDDDVNNSSSSSNNNPDRTDNNHLTHARAPSVVDGVAIVELYASLKQGQSVKQWYAQHSNRLSYIDIRRFITFGIIKGFLYRVHKYAYATGFPKHHNHHRNNNNNKNNNNNNNHGYYYNQYYPGITSGLSSRGPGTGTNSPRASSAGDSQLQLQSTSAQSGSTTMNSHTATATGVSVDDNDDDHDHDNDRDRDPEEREDEEDLIDDRTLVKYLDGMHCFDQICTELELSERQLMGRLRRYSGEVMVIHR